MSNPVCVDCGVEMRMYKTGTAVVFHDSVDAPYYNTDADVYRCPRCLKKVAVGFGSRYYDEISMKFAMSTNGCIIVRETFLIKVPNEKKTANAHRIRESARLEEAIRSVVHRKE